jgi:excisionase family DNA binding protein
LKGAFHVVNPETPQFVTVDTAARLSGVPESTIRSMIQRGVLERRKFGGRVLVERARVEQMLARPPAEAASK